MPSIFDFLFEPSASAVVPPAGPNARPSSILDSPGYRSQRLTDTLLGLSQGLLKAGAPSPYPVDFGQVLGMAGAGAAQGAAGSEDKYLKRALTDAQVQAAQAEAANDRESQAMFKRAGAAPSPLAVATPAVSAADSLAKARDAIGSIEGNYGSIGPATMRDGKESKPYGRYQVMDFNIPEWSQAALGKTLTPAQFLMDPKAQDAVFDHRFGQYQTQYGNPHDAASAWFTGRPRAAAGTAPDVLGTTPQAYLAKFDKAYGAPPQPAQGNGGGNPVQLAQAAPQAAPQPQTMEEVARAMPAPLLQMLGNMKAKTALPFLMKYADPETHVAIDSTTGAVVFAPKNDRSGRYRPVDAAKLDMDAQRLEMDRRRLGGEEANRKVGPGGVPNRGVIEAEKEITAATGTGALEPHGVKIQMDEVNKRHSDAQTQAAQARTKIANLDRIGTLMDQVSTGKFTGTVQSLKAAAKGIGIDLEAMGVSDNVGLSQAADALSKGMTLAMRDPSGGAGMPGALSDADRKFLSQMVPSLETDPAGRKLMIDFQKRLAQREIDVANKINEHLRSPEFRKDPSSIYGKIQKFADENPLFDPAKDMPAAPAAAPGAVRRYNPATGRIE